MYQVALKCGFCGVSTARQISSFPRIAVFAKLANALLGWSESRRCGTCRSMGPGQEMASLPRHVKPVFTRGLPGHLRHSTDTA